MSTEKLRPLAEVSARRMVAVFLVATFALTWLMFLPVIVGLADPEFPAGVIFLPVIGVGAPTIELTRRIQARTSVAARSDADDG